LFRRADRCLRNAGRLTSDIRDAEVRLQTVRQLQGITQRNGRRAFGKLEGMLMLELENFMAAFAEWQTQAVPMLEQTLADTECWALDHFKCKQLRRAVQLSYKRGRDSLARAKENSNPESFHEFRTETKTLWYQLRILRPSNPVVLKSLANDLHSIGDLLGRAHDFSFLGDRLRGEHGKSEWEQEGRKLLAVIEVSQADLQRGAADLAERFYAERPRDFGDRIAAWLEDWEKAASPSLTEKLVT
jgi:CHAD domain-containing protein